MIEIPEHTSNAISVKLVVILSVLSYAYNHMIEYLPLYNKYVDFFIQTGTAIIVIIRLVQYARNYLKKRNEKTE